LNRSQNTDPTDEMRSHDIKRTQMMQTTGWPHSGLKNMVLNCLIQMDSIWFKLRRVLELHLLSFIEVHVSMFLCRSIRIFTLIHTSSTVVQVSSIQAFDLRVRIRAGCQLLPPVLRRLGGCADLSEMAISSHDWIWASPKIRYPLVI
jgi:hypothetical protein